MLLQEFITQVCVELEILPIPSFGEKKMLNLGFSEDVEVEIRDLEPGIAFFSRVIPVPLERKEELFIHLMRANYLGQLTGASRIGMSDDEKFLTLSLGMPYELNYRTFRETLEDFINFLLYWREIVEKFERQETVL